MWLEGDGGGDWKGCHSSWLFCVRTDVVVDGCLFCFALLLFDVQGQAMCMECERGSFQNLTVCGRRGWKKRGGYAFVRSFATS